MPTVGTRKGEGGAAEPSGAPQRATILIVDDTAANLMVLGELLQSSYQVRVATSGEKALQVAASEPRPDLILLDVMMPAVDGFEVFRRLRADPLTAEIPVIFVTAARDEEMELAGFELGAADYIHKPIKPSIALSRIRVQLDAKAARDMLRKNNQRLVRQVEQGAHALEEAQLQLLQAEKMAAVGQLAAGIAHEINNPIAFVASNLGTLTSYMQELLPLLDACTSACQGRQEEVFAEVERLGKKVDYDFLRQDIPALVAESRDGIERVRKIVLDLKNFSRIGDLDWEWADIHAGLDSTLNIAWNELKYHCTVTRQYAALPRVYCLPSHLNQVFMNLLLNAGQAIEGKGEITLITERVGEDAVAITVADTGSGISPEALPRIFDPFFTTKPAGKGTGLGLSLVWRIIEQHRGRIEVESEAGKGSRFRIILPIDPLASAPEAVAEGGGGSSG